MNSRIRRFVIRILVTLVVTLAIPVPSGTAEARHYVCVPCGLPCDSGVFDAPGTCPKCGMALVDQDSAAALQTPSLKVAILIFDGVEIIDYTGPYEVFGSAGFDVYTVAATPDPITSAMGMTVIPKFTFANAPQPDVLVVPGGGVKVARDHAPTLKWIRETTARDRQTMSVCNGAFILASAGLLDGLEATTTSGNIERLRREFPKVSVIEDRRYVDNGKIITTGGLTAGIDGALHVVDKLIGRGNAQAVALGEEYEWRPEGGFARASLADRQIPDLDLDRIGKWEYAHTQGGTDRWDVAVRGRSDLGVTGLMDYLAKGLEEKGKWTLVKSHPSGADSAAITDWKFRGRDGKPWVGTLTVRSAFGHGPEFLASLRISRSS